MERSGGKTKAKFVWGDVSGPNCYCRFLHRFEAETGGEFSLRISADSDYCVWLNGEYVGAGQYTDYPEYRVYDTYEVTSHMRDGENVVAVLGYCYNESSSVYKRGRPCILFSLDCGEAEICASGEKTFWAPSYSYLSGEGAEKFSPQLSYGYEFDATKEDAWLSFEYRRGKFWKRCKLLDYRTELLSRPIERLDVLPEIRAEIIAQGYFIDDPSVTSRAKRMQTAYLSAAELKEMTGGSVERLLPSGEGIALRGNGRDIYFVADLGKESSGWLCLDIAADYGTRIDIGFGEHLDDLRVRSWVGGRCFAVGYTATQGRQKFVHRLKRLGGRYIQLHIHSDRARIYYAGLLPTVYPVEPRSKLELGDRLHQKIYDTCVDTVRLCMHEHYEDTPWREQALYAMDSRNQMLFGYYAFGEYEFAKSSLNA